MKKIVAMDARETDTGEGSEILKVNTMMRWCTREKHCLSGVGRVCVRPEQLVWCPD